MKPLRTFIAVNVSPETCTVAGRLLKQLGAIDDGVKTVKNQNLHITLKFLGEVLVEDTPAICAAVEQACQSISDFEITSGGLGAFPDQDRPRTLWMGVEQGVGVTTVGGDDLPRRDVRTAHGAQGTETEYRRQEAWPGVWLHRPDL